MRPSARPCTVVDPSWRERSTWTVPGVWSRQAAGSGALTQPTRSWTGRATGRRPRCASAITARNSLTTKLLRWQRRHRGYLPGGQDFAPPAGTDDRRLLMRVGPSCPRFELQSRLELHDLEGVCSRSLRVWHDIDGPLGRHTAGQQRCAAEIAFWQPVACRPPILDTTNPSTCLPPGVR